MLTVPGMNQQASLATSYLELLKRCLTRLLFEDPVYVPFEKFLPRWIKPLIYPVSSILDLKDLHLMKRTLGDSEVRTNGLDHPDHAETMIGLKRMNNIQELVVNIIRNDVPGDLIEAGVWRGGATIFMRGILKAYNDSARLVWVADSFQGLPSPNSSHYPLDADSRWHKCPELAVSLDIVKNNFARYGLLDDQVRFLVGWFRDTLPTAPMSKLALLRIDGDMYESTMDALVHLYPKLSIGGFVIVDDYYDIRSCRAAVDDYRAEHGVTDEIKRIDWTGIYWQKNALIPSKHILRCADSRGQ